MIPSRTQIIAAIGGTVAILFLIVLLFAANSKIDLRTIERDNARAEAKAEAAAHQETERRYRAAAAIAQADARRNVARVTAEQAAITKGTVDDYQKRLADIDARYERVRAQLAARSDLRSTDAAPMSIASNATCRAYGGTDCDGLLAKLKIAERQAQNLIALRQWARDQAVVVVEPEGDRK
jgi:Na+-transporting methylmalonyl-CoA/oxaloacetate decarboxylase gamma subunit